MTRAPGQPPLIFTQTGMLKMAQKMLSSKRSFDGRLPLCNGMAGMVKIWA